MSWHTYISNSENQVGAEVSSVLNRCSAIEFDNGWAILILKFLMMEFASDLYLVLCNQKEPVKALEAQLLLLD